MSEMLIRVVSKTHTDPVIDAGLSKRGDVIIAFEDGHAWSDTEKTLPDWRIIRVKNTPVSTISQLLSREVPTSPAGDQLLQYRGSYLDIDNAQLPKPLKDFLADATRAQPLFELSEGVASHLINTISRRPKRTINKGI
jgi:hypothetical protein